MNQSNEIKLEEVKKLRSNIYENHQKSYLKDYIKVGDYTYGKPIIKAWDDKTHLTIGKFCSIAENVTIMLGGEHRTDWISTYPFNCLMESYKEIKGPPATKGDIIIGNDVWIAQGVRIMSGVTIGDGAVIGANALVTKDVPSYAIVGGCPANVIKYRFKKKVIKRLLEIKWWNLDDEFIVEAIPLLQSGDVESLFSLYDKMKGNL